MSKEDIINHLVDNAVNYFDTYRSVERRQSKIVKLMPLIKSKSDMVREKPDSNEAYIYCNGFVAGYESREESIWHKPNNGDPSLYLMLIELNNGEFELDYTYDPANTKRWAYVKDLLPKEGEK